jgi:hypothetical protein
MPSTPHYLLPYPVGTDPADGPKGIGDLAVKTDDVIFTSIWTPLNNRVAALEAVPAVVVPRMVRGRVTGATGGVAAGTGFSSQRTAPGQYAIYFSAGFPATPALLATIDDSSDRRITVWGIGPASFSVNTRNASGVLTDTDFSFLAVAM